MRILALAAALLLSLTSRVAAAHEGEESCHHPTGEGHDKKADAAGQKDSTEVHDNFL